MSFSAPIFTILHPGALGDGLLALSALRMLRKNFPRHSVIWFGHKELGKILLAAREVHQSYSFENVTFLGYAGGPSFQQQKITALFARCDRVVGWMNDSEGVWQEFFTSIGIKQYILRSPHDPDLRQYHMVDRYVETLQLWYPTQKMFDQQSEILVISAKCKARDHFYSPEKPLVILHPGSGSPFKCAPPVIWANLINGLAARPHREICLVGGPADTDILHKVKNLITEVKLTILTGLDLISVGKKLQHAQLYIGNDSGLSHLAAHLGIPSILLFGATDPAKWAPRGDHIRVVENFGLCKGGNPFFSISTDRILEIADEILDGIPNSRKQVPGGNDFSCTPCLD